MSTALALAFTSLVFTNSLPLTVAGQWRSASAQRAMTQPTPGLRRELLDAVRGDKPTIERARIARVELPPGQHAGRHRHPSRVIGALSGMIRFQVADAPAQLLGAGEAFHEPAGIEIPHLDNASHSEPAVFLACYLLPPGETRLIEMLPPG